MNEEGGCSNTVSANFAEDKLEVEMLDKELEMFKEKKYLCCYLWIA